MNTFEKKIVDDVRDRMLDENPSLARPGDCRVDRRITSLKASMENKTYTVNRKTYTQPEIMERIIEWMTDARNPRSIKEICSMDGAPSLREVFAWRRAFPTFNNEFKDAELIRATLLSEQSVEVVMGEENPKAAALAKAKAESLRWLSSKLDPQKFGDRKAESAEDDFKNSTITQLMDTVRESIKANAQIIETLSAEERRRFQEIGVIDAEVVEKPNGQREEPASGDDRGDGPQT